VIERLLEAERNLSMGLLDHAERIYRQVHEADPRNAIALVGLARVAVERGQDAEAYAFATKALDIDPDNAAARTIVVRLHEVLSARGESLELPGALAPTGSKRRGIVDRLLRRGSP
jgi:tetratricopeptide (TPR) repeat protein